jgi:hypothetical protein
MSANNNNYTQYSVQAARFTVEFDDDNSQHQTFERQNRRQKARGKKWERKNPDEIEEIRHQKSQTQSRHNRY